MPKGIFSRILVALDGSENSARAASVAVGLAKASGASLFVLHVIQRPLMAEEGVRALVPSEPFMAQYINASKKTAEKWVGGVVSDAKRQRVKVRGEVIQNVPSVVQTITENASDWNVDLIVLGTRGLTGFKKLLMGSVSSGVLNHATCSVLVVR